jgi:hypothetical protein
MINSDEIELIKLQTDDDVYCCICLNTDKMSHDQFNSKIIKMNCCNQNLHENCFLEWILYPITRNHNYNNKLYCIICKSKIKNLKNIITLGDFINYVESNQCETDDKEFISYCKKIISDFYKDSIMTIIINSDELEEQHNKEFNFCFCNLFYTIFFFMLIILLIIIGDIFVKNEI